MTTYFPCPYLEADVEVTEEREKHIAENHPDLLPEYRQCIAETLANPDMVRRSERFENARMFSRWFETVKGGKYVVVFVVSDLFPDIRHWIITSYITKKLSQGAIEWKRN
ncbi:MAG: hypothetical protein HQK67_07515 [Desulfamplus sp.]|nr:hypothetical protein [Desulfamplus sp.]